MTKQKTYTDCGACGRLAAFMVSGRVFVTRHADQRIDVPVGPLARATGRCAGCERPSLLVTIKVRVRFQGETVPACGSACLNGKTSCDCKCAGRCHGAGRCYCAVAA